MTRPTTVVYVATSLDGYISRPDGGIDWLVPFEDRNVEKRFRQFLATIDAVVLGRNTFQQVLTFPSWPYGGLPVYLLSRTLKRLPRPTPSTVTLRHAAPEELLSELHSEHFGRVYVDGGETIRRFLDCDLIDELIITRVPVVLGAGRTLFGGVSVDLAFRHVSTDIYSTGAVHSAYIRTRT